MYSLTEFLKQPNSIGNILIIIISDSYLSNLSIEMSNITHKVPQLITNRPGI